MNNAVSRSEAGQYWMLGIPLLVLGLITFGIGGFAAGLLGYGASRAGQPGGKTLCFFLEANWSLKNRIKNASSLCKSSGEFVSEVYGCRREVCDCESSHLLLLNVESDGVDVSVGDRRKRD